MPNNREAEIKNLFLAVVELPSEHRAAHLEAVCRDHPELREPVEELLRHESEADTHFLDPMTELGDVAGETSMPEQIGPYKILETLGEGGMGVVYLAQQTEPVNRQVALKVIKLGMDTKQVIARFEQERNALALMNHPHVAKVFDAGITPPETGSRPYFVMEHVAGTAITDHCDRQRLSLNDRLKIFIQVCAAVQHAHQHGIIHRDLKPSNIIVDASGSPRVIDFGVAKATRQKLTENTLFTEQGQLIGTPEYMSPEQAEMTAQDIDTRSDIYSLGVILYQLLAGALPFEPGTLRRHALSEIQRIIRQEEPSKPSTRLSKMGDQTPASLPRDGGEPGRGSGGSSAAAIAKSRRLDLRSLTRHLRGDLDWIVMMCLEKDRNRRYETADGLAADLERHLNNKPVMAGPPSTAYKMRKFIRRNRAGVIVGCVVAAMLVVAMVVFSFFPSGIINVPGDYPTIQGAIFAAAFSGDEIIVAPGTYPEVINFNGKEIYLHSASGIPADTIIDGIGLGNSVVLCVNGEGAGTVLEGFTITGGSGNTVFKRKHAGGGMLNFNSSPTITNCIFSGNSAANGGAMLNNSSSPTVTNCAFIGNTASNAGGGMFNQLGSSLTITNCTFSGNTAINAGGMVNMSDSHPTVTNCIFRGNSPNAIVNSSNTSATPTISFSNVQGGLGARSIDGGGNIDVDPLFVDVDGPDNIPGTLDDDLRLASGSPCTDAGNNSAPGLAGLTTDLDGNPRFFDDLSVADTGDGIAPIVDMGAYER